MIKKYSKVDMIEVTEFGNIQVRTVTNITENEKIISKTFHRHIIEYGSNYDNEELLVQEICKIVHSPEMIEMLKNNSSLQGE